MYWRILLSFTTLAVVASAHGQSASTVSGTINRMDFVASAGGAPNNGDTRVYLNGVTTFCSGTSDPTWAFVNTSDANYKGVLASLLMAYATGKQVSVTSIAGAGTSGPRCQIEYVSMVN